MLSKELEDCLNGAFHQASVARHQYLTVEHLLLSIVATPEVTEILSACGTNPTQLKQDLQEHIDQSTPRHEGEVQPTLAFQRVLQRAVFHVQSSGKKEVSVGNVLVAIFSEKQSHAVFLLNQRHVTRLGVVNYRSHGLSEISYARADDDNESEVESNGDSTPTEPGKNERRWHLDLERFEKLLVTMGGADIESLMQRSEHDPKSLSIDEVGVLFLWLRERVRALEARLKNDSDTSDT